MVTPNREAESKTAAHFVARMDADSWSAADEGELQAWLAGNPMRHGLLLEMQAEWFALTPAAIEEPLYLEPEEEAEPEAAPRWGRRSILAGLAASAAAVFFAARWRDGASEYATRLGEIRRLPLADGSVMTMNSGSNLSVAMAKEARQIELTQGEAWFEVAKDPRRPFVVAAGNVRVRAVGTAFSVRRRETGVEVQVTEGVVETWSEGDSSLRMRLAAGDRAMISAHAVVDYETGISSSVDRSLAWRSGMIDLNGLTLAQAAEEFNRYNQRQIIIADPHIAREELDGLFRINDPDGFAASVKVTMGVSVDTSDPGLIRIK
jgi:transmembrane sensor